MTNDEIAKQKKEYRRTHKEEIRAYKNEYYRTHKKEFKAMYDKYRQTHKKKVIESNILYNTFKTARVLSLCKKTIAIKRALNKNILDAQLLNKISKGETHEAYI